MTMPTPSPERIQQCLDQLLGSFASIDAVLTEDEVTDVEFMEELAGSIQECGSCNWWVEVCELDDAGYCPDCHEENDEE
jgi:hypothetical protein